MRSLRRQRCGIQPPGIGTRRKDSSALRYDQRGSRYSGWTRRRVTTIALSGLSRRRIAPIRVRAATRIPLHLARHRRRDGKRRDRTTFCDTVGRTAFDVGRAVQTLRKGPRRSFTVVKEETMPAAADVGAIGTALPVRAALQKALVPALFVL